MVFVSLVRAMIDAYPTEPALPTLPQLTLPLANLGIATALTAAGAVILAWLLPKTPCTTPLVLDQDAGCSAALPDVPNLSPGDRGTSQSPLRPSGRALINNQPVDVVTEGDYLPPGTALIVLRVEG
ncbi:MAG: hypothetical protein HC901_01595, partial [Bdellovibrionaceae bacterium]|nr:hypothetical protein [Pseudobdellovibrionaceae bacterium]